MSTKSTDTTLESTSKTTEPNCERCGDKGFITYWYLSGEHAVTCSCQPLYACPKCGIQFHGDPEHAAFRHKDWCKYKTAWGHIALRKLLEIKQ